MDSGDHSDNRLKASDSGFSGFRSQSFSNLFQGFFGVKRAPASVADIRCSASEEMTPREDRSLETIVSPSNDEDSWILSHFLPSRPERDDASSLRRNATLSELEKRGHIHSQEPLTSASSAGDLRKGTRSERLASPAISQIWAEDEGEMSIGTGSQTAEEKERFENPDKPRIIVAKSVEQSHYPINMLSSFLSQDEVKPRNDSELLHSEHQASTFVTDATAGYSESSVKASAAVRVDQTLVTSAVLTGDKLPESKPTIRDLLWSFNHEKIKVSKKEMNLIASVDQ